MGSYSETVVRVSVFNTLTPGVHLKGIHTWLNLQLSATCLFKCMDDFFCEHHTLKGQKCSKISTKFPGF